MDEYSYIENGTTYTDTEMHARYEALNGIDGTGLEYLDWIDTLRVTEVENY